MMFKPWIHRCLSGVFMAATSLAQAQVQRCEVNGVEVSPNHGGTTAGKTGIMRCRLADTGVLAREQELRDGKFVGSMKQYEAGVLRRDYAVNEQGNRHGRYREYSATGQLLRDETYQNGESIGFTKVFFPSGQLSRLSYREPPDQSASSRASARELASVDFTESGQLRELRCAAQPVLGAGGFDDTKPCGFAGAQQVELFRGQRLSARVTYERGRNVREEGYFDNGGVRYQTERPLDAPQGRVVERTFYPSGVKRREASTIQTDQGRRRELETEFSERGTPVLEKRYSDVGQISERAWYLNQQLRYETEWSATDPAQPRILNRRVERTYFDSGRLASEGAFQTQGRGSEIAVGAHKSFDESQRLRFERIHDAQGKPTRERQFSEAGALIRDDEIFEDGSRRAFTAR
jgi:antitoxin component YwqK of YwqJK toxin-antitoxin module